MRKPWRIWRVGQIAWIGIELSRMGDAAVVNKEVDMEEVKVAVDMEADTTTKK